MAIGLQDHEIASETRRLTDLAVEGQHDNNFHYVIKILISQFWNIYTRVESQIQQI